jgi:hypothetical protein
VATLILLGPPMMLMPQATLAAIERLRDVYAAKTAG